MLYDQYGRPVGYVSTIWLANELFYFLDVDSNIRIKNGKIQLLNETDNKWYTLKCRSIEGIANLYLPDVGESS